MSVSKKNQQGTNKWTYVLTNYLMVHLGIRMALAFMTYVANLDAYELNLGHEKGLYNFIDKC